MGNNTICSDIWHKYHKWCFKIVTCNFTSGQASEIWDNFEISQVVFMPNIMYKPCYYLFNTTTGNSFVIFTCRYFKLSWNTTALSQPNCRNFSCSIIMNDNTMKQSTGTAMVVIALISFRIYSWSYFEWADVCYNTGPSGTAKNKTLGLSFSLISG